MGNNTLQVERKGWAGGWSEGLNWFEKGVEKKGGRREKFHGEEDTDRRRERVGSRVNSKGGNVFNGDNSFKNFR